MNLIGQSFLVGSQGKVKNTVRKPHVTGWGVGGDGRCNSHILEYMGCAISLKVHFRLENMVRPIL